MNCHGSSGYGQEFTDSITGALGDKPLADLMRSTEWFEKQLWIEKNRMAAAGASSGGYMMAWLNGHTDRFKAMVCHAGVYDWHAMLAMDLIRRWFRALALPLRRSLDRRQAIRPAIRGQLQDPDARTAWGERLSRARDRRSGLLQHAQAERRSHTTRLLPG